MSQGEKKKKDRFRALFGDALNRGNITGQHNTRTYSITVFAAT